MEDDKITFRDWMMQTWVMDVDEGLGSRTEDFMRDVNNNFTYNKNIPTPNISGKLLKAVLTKKAYKSLNNFMFGQTGLVRDDGNLGIYLWDFERWLKYYNKKMIK